MLNVYVFDFCRNLPHVRIFMYAIYTTWYYIEPCLSFVLERNRSKTRKSEIAAWSDRETESSDKICVRIVGRERRKDTTTAVRDPRTVSVS